MMRQLAHIRSVESQRRSYTENRSVCYNKILESDDDNKSGQPSSAQNAAAVRLKDPRQGKNRTAVQQNSKIKMTGKDVGEPGATFNMNSCIGTSLQNPDSWLSSVPVYQQIGGIRSLAMQPIIDKLQAEAEREENAAKKDPLSICQSPGPSIAGSPSAVLASTVVMSNPQAVYPPKLPETKTVTATRAGK